MFGCLFGVRNHAGFDPIAEGRGLPENLSRELREEYETWSMDAHSASYITAADLKKIDWAEEAEEADDRVHIYNGDDEYCGKFGDSSSLSAEDWERLRDGETIERETEHDHLIHGIAEGETIKYKLETITRKDARSPAWENLFEVMQALAEGFGDENVRLVV